MPRTARQFATTIMILIAVLVLGTGIAAAHATVVSTNPADGGSVPSSPAEISVTFSENVSVVSGGLTLLDADGSRVDDGGSRVVDGRTLMAAPSNPLANGTYVATYRVLSADGHPVSGSFLFGVGSGTVDQSARPDSSGDRFWNVLGGVSRFVMYLAGLLAAGVAFFLAFIHDHGSDRWRIVPFVRIGSLLALFGAFGIVMSQAALLTGRGASAVTDTDVLRDVLSENLGWSLALFLFGLAGVHLSTDITKTTASQVLALYGSIFVTASFAVWGHASELPPSFISIAADLVHVTSAALWLGGLVGLMMILLLRTADTVASTAVILRRFSLAAMISAIALGIAGLALTLTGSNASWHALVTTTWGQLVLVKIGLTSVIIAIAAWNRRRLVPSLVTPSTSASVRTAKWKMLLRTVRLEAVILVAIVGLTSILVNVPPARTAVSADAPTIVTVTRPVDTGSLTLTVEPAVVGTNRTEARFTSANGQPFDVANTMTIEFSQPSAGLAPLTRQVPATSPGVFVIEGNEFSITGTWTVTIAVRTGDFSEQRTSFEVPITR